MEDGTVFNEPVVTIEKFGEMLNWFGPIVDEQGKVAIFDNVRSLLSGDLLHVVNVLILLCSC